MSCLQGGGPGEVRVCCGTFVGFVDSNMSHDTFDVFENLRVIVFVSQVCGLVPLRPGGKVAKYATFLYSMAVTAFYVYVCISFNLYVLGGMQNAAANVKLLRKIIYVEITVRCVLLLILLLLNQLKSGRFLKILHTLRTFDITLQREMRTEVPLKQNRVLQYIYAGYVVFFVIYYAAQLHAAKYGWLYSIMWVTTCNVNLVILSQFTIFVHAFGTRFRLFNNFLANVNVSFPVLKRQTFRFRNFNVSALNQFELKDLHVVYSSMRKLLQDINSHFSLQIFLIVCETVVTMIGGISTATFNIIYDDYVIRSTYRNLTLIHNVLKLLSITFLVYVAEETSKEVSEKLRSDKSRIEVVKN